MIENKPCQLRCRVDYKAMMQLHSPWIEVLGFNGNLNIENIPCQLRCRVDYVAVKQLHSPWIEVLLQRTASSDESLEDDSSHPTPDDQSQMKQVNSKCLHSIHLGGMRSGIFITIDIVY